MSKRQKQKAEKRRNWKKLVKGPFDGFAPRTSECLVSLNQIASTGCIPYCVEKAQSLLAWYNDNGDLSAKQRAFAHVLAVRESAHKTKVLGATADDKKFYLYAIGDNKIVKLGFTHSLESRRKALQTAQAVNLEVLWTFYVGTDRAFARESERKLHRHCKRYHERGEWFKAGVMDLVRLFTLDRPKPPKELSVNNIQELEILNEARSRI